MKGEGSPSVNCYRPEAVAWSSEAPFGAARHTGLFSVASAQG